MAQMLRIWKHVPGLPECAHFLRKTQRDSDVCVHGREGASDQNITVAEMLDHLLSGMKGIHHHKVGMRIDEFKRTSHDSIKEFLTVVRVVLNEIVHSPQAAAVALDDTESRPH